MMNADVGSHTGLLALLLLVCASTFACADMAYNCSLCGGDKLQVVNLDAEVLLPGQPVRTCKDLVLANQAGAISEVSCSMLTMFTPAICCMGNATETNFTISAAPTMAPLPDLVTILEGAGTFTYLITALNATDLLGALTSPAGPYTVFAPLDAAFEAFPPAIVDALLTPAFADLLSGILLYHVVPGIYTPADLFDGMNLTTLAEEPILISVVNETSISVNGIPVVGSDILASNGVIYPIAGVLLPPSFNLSLF